MRYGCNNRSEGWDEGRICVSSERKSVRERERLYDGMQNGTDIHTPSMHFEWWTQFTYK